MPNTSGQEVEPLVLESRDDHERHLYEDQQALRDHIERLRSEQQRLRDELERRGSNGNGGPQTASEQQPQPEKKEESAPKPPVEERTRGFVRRHPVLLIVGILLLGALAVGGYFLMGYLHSYEETDDAQIDGHLNNVSSRISGTVVAVYVQENQFVKQGQVLVDIDPRDYQVAVEQARANLAQAQAELQSENPNVSITATTIQTNISTGQSDVTTAEAGEAAAERDYDAALARIREAEANNAKAQADVARYKQLVDKEEISRQQYDATVAAAKAGEAAVQSSQAAAASAAKIVDERKSQLTQTRRRLQEVNQNAPRQVAIRRADVAGKQASVDAAKAALDQAMLNVQYTKILAPVDGVVGKKAAEVGTRVSPGQDLLSIVPLNDIWVTANFKETQLRNIQPRQRATIKVDAFGREYEGYVESMPATSGARLSLLPPENATGNYVKVVQRLPLRLRFKPDQDPEHRLRPGMSVEPKVWIK